MTNQEPTPAPEQLLAQRDFVRGLVRSLMRGADGEEDVVQQALVRGLQHRPDADSGWRPWLARVCRNLAFDHLRRQRRRTRREHARATPEALPSAAEVLEREEQRQLVVAAVLALPQPYRGVIVLRYLDELSPAQIAARLGVPGATVRSQLERGRAMLRARLDGDYGGRKAWLVALAPCAGREGATAGAVAGGSIGAIVMSTKVKTSLTVAAVAAAALLIWIGVRPHDSDAPDGTGDPGPATRVVAMDGAAALEQQDGDLAASPVRVTVAGEGQVVVNGQVLRHGAPTPGAWLTLQIGEGLEWDAPPVVQHELCCDDEGRFRWSFAPFDGPVTIRVDPRGRSGQVWGDPVLVWPGEREATLELELVALDRRVHGVVRDVVGRPLAAASVSINGWRETTSDVDGGYELNVPGGDDSRPLLASAPGYAGRLVNLQFPGEARELALDITLSRGAVLAGRVVDSAGAPVAGATVRSSGLFLDTETDSAGCFVLDGAERDAAHELWATKAGHRTATVLAAAGSEQLELVLQPRQGRPLSVCVVDLHGQPVRGAAIAVIGQQGRGWRRRAFTDSAGRARVGDVEPDEIVVTADRRGFVRARRKIQVGDASEELVIPLAPGHALHGIVVDAAGAPVAGASLYASMSAGVDEWVSVGVRSSSKADGRFVIADVPAEPVRVRAWLLGFDPAVVDGVIAGSGEARLRLVRSPSVAGRVIDAVTGAPIDSFSVRSSIAPNDAKPFRADDGRFVLTDSRWTADTEVELQIGADGYAPTTVEAVAPSGPSSDPMTVELHAGSHVSGVLRGASDGAPVPGIRVELCRPDGTRAAARGARCGITCGPT